MADLLDHILVILVDLEHGHHATGIRGAHRKPCAHQMRPVSISRASHILLSAFDQCPEMQGGFFIDIGAPVSESAMAFTSRLNRPAGRMNGSPDWPVAAGS